MSSAIVIVGTGLAGYTLAREFRKHDSATPLCLITRDDGCFYSKPMLSNALAKQKTPDTLVGADVEKMRADLDAEILAATGLESIDLSARELTLTDGSRRKYGRLVLAIGAQTISPGLRGDAADQVLSVNSLQDYREFRRRLQSAKRIAIIGPGLIGCEFANDLAGAGYAVDVIGPDSWPLGRLLPAMSGAALRSALQAAGINWHLQHTAQALEATADRLRVVLDDGSELETDLVLSAIGLRPNTGLAESAGLQVNRGIVVDRYLRSSDPQVYAIGDCAEVAGLVLPFVLPLMQQARALAATLSGSETALTYPPMPVLVKTASYPVVVSPPPFEAQGVWEETPLEGGVKALFKSGDSLLGFALCGSAVSERQSLSKSLPMLLA